MKLRSLLLSVYGILISLTVISQQATQSIQAGNDLYKQQKFDQAELQYSKAIEQEPVNLTAKFNLANTYYKEGKQEEAIHLFNDLSNNSKETGLLSNTFYNKGVVLSNQKKLEESIEAYKNALRKDPEDKDARENLQKALLELKKKTPPPKKEKENKKNKQQQQQKQQQQPKMNQNEAQQRLKLLEQKEKEVQQRIQKEKSKTGGNQNKDW